MIRYKSKIGLEVIIFGLVILGGVAFEMVQAQLWVPFAGVIACAVFVIHILFTTYYIIEDKILNIRCSFLVNEKIYIERIKKITETNNPLSAPAASLDRLEILYNKTDRVLISPKHKMEFIKELTRINPEIEVVLKYIK